MHAKKHMENDMPRPTPLSAAPNGYRCPFEITLDIIGGKWKLLVIYFLSQHDILRFGELRRSLPEISERMLVRQLRELENDAIVNRKVYGTVPPRVDYSLTELGRSLVPIMHELKAWGVMYEKQGHAGKPEARGRQEEA